MQRPATLTIAVVLQWIGAVFSFIVGLPLMFAGLFSGNPDLEQTWNDAINDAASSGQIPQDNAEQLLDINPDVILFSLSVAGAFLVAIGIIRAIIAVFLGKGHNWARIVLTVFFVLGMISSIGQMFAGTGVAGVVGGLISLAIEVFLLWLMWNPKSSAYIEERTQARQLAKMGGQVPPAATA
jgi:L-lactate permease